MKKLLFLLGLFICTGASAQFCGPYTTHAPISLSGASSQTISGDSINCSGAIGIYIQNSHDIHIKKCRITNGGIAYGAIYVYNSYNITIDSCYIDNVHFGLNAVSCPSGGIVFKNNYCVNMQGVLTGTTSGGQMVQFNQVSGSGNKILYNKLEDFDGASNPTDGISTYKCNGTFASRIEVAHNWIRRNVPICRTGSAIMSGDNGGSYIWVHDNITVSPGNVAYGIAGGTHISVVNNTVYSPHHAGSTVANVALVFNNFTPTITACNTDTMSGNVVNWFSDRYYDGVHAYSAVNNAYNPGSCTIFGSNTYAAAIDATILPAQLVTTCVPVIPLPAVTYSPSSYTFTYGQTITSISPVNTGGTAVSFSISPSLPSGLSFNTSTGLIYGSALQVHTSTSYRVIASNAGGNDTTFVSITVNKASLIITCDNKKKAYKTVNPVLTAHYSIPGAVLATPPTITTTAVTLSPVGNYPITASGASSPNYNISYVSGTLTVTSYSSGGPRVGIKVKVL